MHFKPIVHQIFFLDIMYRSTDGETLLLEGNQAIRRGALFRECTVDVDPLPLFLVDSIFLLKYFFDLFLCGRRVKLEKLQEDTAGRSTSLVILKQTHSVKREGHVTKQHNGDSFRLLGWTQISWRLREFPTCAESALQTKLGHMNFQTTPSYVQKSKTRIVSTLQ